jgi:hypothetical protein
MDDEVEISVLRFLTKEENLGGFRPLSKVFAQVRREAKIKKTKAFTTGNVTQKDALRMIMDNMSLHDLLDIRFREGELEPVYRARNTGLYDEFGSLPSEESLDDIEGMRLGRKLPRLPKGFQLTEAKREQLIILLKDAELKLDCIDATNNEKSTARAYIIAALTLADAPDPPIDILWEAINRANSVAGVASLLVAVVALFLAAK